MNTPTLTIIIPVYNTGTAIRTIVSQITSQSYRDFELILVDDGSTDDTLKVLRGLASEDKRIVVRSQKNGGPSSARNSGLQKARGQYIMFCDADDSIDSELFLTMVREIDDDLTDIVVSGWQVDLRLNSKLVRGYKSISPEREIITGTEVARKTAIMKSLGTNGQLYNLWNKIFRRDIIEKHNLRFREDIHFGEDLIFSLHYLQSARQIKLIPDTLYHYQTNSETSLFSSSALVPKYRTENYKALEEFYNNSKDDELTAQYYWVKWRWLLSYHLIVAKSSRSLADKLSLIRQIVVPNPVVSKYSYIGTKKWCIELLLYITHRSAIVSFLLASIINFIKNIIIQIRSRRIT